MSSFAEVPLYLLIAGRSAGQLSGKPPSAAEPRIELVPAFQQTDALLTELCRILGVRLPTSLFYIERDPHQQNGDRRKRHSSSTHE
jgi:hypothetical protein